MISSMARVCTHAVVSPTLSKAVVALLRYGARYGWRFNPTWGVDWGKGMEERRRVRMLDVFWLAGGEAVEDRM